MDSISKKIREEIKPGIHIEHLPGTEVTDKKVPPPQDLKEIIKNERQ